jgi:hypothetical protein
LPAFLATNQIPREYKHPACVFVQYKSIYNEQRKKDSTDTLSAFPQAECRRSQVLPGRLTHQSEMQAGLLSESSAVFANSLYLWFNEPAPAFQPELT